MSVEKTQFNAIKYTTKDGENITATKQDGIVTLVGDKNGVRQMPLNQFMQEFVQNVPQINNGQPKNDTVSFSGQPDKTLDGAKNSKKGLLATLGLLLLAGGAYVLTRGRNSKAAKVAQEAGQEIIEQGAKKGSKAAQEVAEEVIPVGQKAVQEVAEEVVPQGKKAAAEIAEEVAPKGKPVVQNAGKATGKKGKETGTAVADAAEKLQKGVDDEIAKQQAIGQLEALGFIVDDAVPANKVADEIVESTKKQIDGVLDNTSLPKVEIPKAEVPEIKIPRQAFEQGGDNAGKLVKDALDDVADDAGKLADEALEGVTPRGSSVVENVTDEGAEAAQKLFGDNSATGVVDDIAGGVDDVLHNPTSFVDDAADYADDIYKHGITDSVDDFATHTDDMFTQHTDDLFAQHTDDLFATHTDDMFGQNVDNMFEPHNFDGGLF